MSSPQPWQASSSPTSPQHLHRKKSRFTYKHLAQLALYSTACPLRVIAHVDLDAFYAQCEGVRLDISPEQPLAVQQWQGLIAINYAARKFGMNRHIAITEAMKLCPDLICQHVATWREGDEKWAYHADAAKNIATHKVSLDPYRLESRRILACIKASLPAQLQKVEKAGIDEVFLDLSAHVHATLLERFPELAGPPPYDDPTERLPLPPTTVLDWQADALIDVDPEEREEDDPDWDDIVMLIASEIVRDVRATIFAQLKYTCAGGIARNKMLAKLGSAYKKPNQQTVVRNRAVQHFLSSFKFTKMRGMGGKLGDEVVEAFTTDTVKDLLPIPLEQLKQRLGDDTGTWVYNIIRGNDTSEISSRTQIKSMLSAKSFRPSINTTEHATRWLRIFVADIFSRLVEEGVLENKRRPRIINLHHRQGGQTRSKQLPIPQGSKIDEASLFGLSRTLLGQIVLEGRAWPCANLSLSIGGFEDGVSGNMGIGTFLVKHEEVSRSSRDSSPSPAATLHPTQATGIESQRASKRRRNDPGITKFFLKHDSTDDGDTMKSPDDTMKSPNDTGAGGSVDPACNPEDKDEAVEIQGDDYRCARCNARLCSSETRQSHDDWHFAKDLQDADRYIPPPTSLAKKSLTTKKVARAPGQTKLAFG